MKATDSVFSASYDRHNDGECAATRIGCLLLSGACWETWEFVGLGPSKHHPERWQKTYTVGFFVTDFEVKNRVLESFPTVSAIKLNVFRRRA